MKSVTIITRPGANEEEQAKAAELAFAEFLRRDKHKEIVYESGPEKFVLPNGNAKIIGEIKTEDAEFEVVQQKQLPAND